MNARKSKKVEQTPTPLRMMEDPTLWHVMPSRAHKKSSHSKMEPPPPKKKKIVLDEDTYVEAIGKVIERDYFPDLDKYRSYLEYLKAIEEKDFDRAERLKYHIQVIQKAETPGATPAVTPCPDGMTPSAEKDVYSKGIGDSEDGNTMVFHDVNNNEIRVPSNISIGELTNMITSEDNQNFQDKQAEELKRHKEKLWWLYDGEDPERKKKLMLMNAEELKLLEDESVRRSWPHRSQNNLMFAPTLEDACATCGVQMIEDIKPAKKLVVVPKNTRLRTKEVDAPLNGPSKPPMPTQELIATPAPEPGVDFEPTMTWGDIEATPLSLGSAVVPADMPMTPLPTANKRDAIADRLYKEMKKKHPPKTPGRMSEAAQKIQQRMRGKTSLNSMLKKAYTPMSNGSAGAAGGVTPRMTPGGKRVQFVSTPASHRTDRSVKLSSVTDNLLYSVYNKHHTFSIWTELQSSRG